MIFPVKADIIQLFKGSVNAMLPFAKANGVALSIESDLPSLEALYQPEQILPDFIKLLCRIITFTPQGYSVIVKVGVSKKKPDSVQIIISNTGSDLSILGDITAQLKYLVSSECIGERTSRFIMLIPIDLTAPEGASSVSGRSIILPWYDEIRKRLTAHFQRIENLEQAAHEKGPLEGIFLQKVNALISSNIDNEQFNARELSAAMALSRSQLHRKLKVLVQMSPSRYIRFVRLSRAKELLEDGDYNISEVAYRVGFVSASHFTRVFQQQFGFNPSALKR